MQCSLQISVNFEEGTTVPGSRTSQLIRGAVLKVLLYLIIIIFINRIWVVTRWQWLFYMYTKHEIGYYQI